MSLPAGPTSGRLARHFLAGRPDRPDLVAKALASEADALFLDFEDACPPRKRAQGRRDLIAALASAPIGHGKTVLVRCNPPDSTDGPADLGACVRSGVRSIIYPKMEEVSDVFRAEEALEGAEREHGLAHGEVALWLMVETARGVVNLGAMLAAATRPVDGVFVGPGDLSSSLRLPQIRGGYINLNHEIIWHCRMQAAVVARAYGVNHLITAAYERSNAFDAIRAVAVRAFEMGYTGVEIQSPRHVHLVDDAWSPALTDLAHAQRVVDAFEASLASDGDGVVLVGDQGIQRPMYEAARLMLAQGTGSSM